MLKTVSASEHRPGQIRAYQRKRTHGGSEEAQSANRTTFGLGDDTRSSFASREMLGRYEPPGSVLPRLPGPLLGADPMWMTQRSVPSGPAAEQDRRLRRTTIFLRFPLCAP